jgi:hypothetical protein
VVIQAALTFRRGRSAVSGTATSGGPWVIAAIGVPEPPFAILVADAAPVGTTITRLFPCPMPGAG